MTKIYDGKVVGNNLRYAFPKQQQGEMERYMATTVEFENKELEGHFSQFEIRGEYKIGSKVQMELTIFEVVE